MKFGKSSSRVKQLDLVKPVDHRSGIDSVAVTRVQPAETLF